VATVCVGAFLGQLDASIATLVLPTLEGVFRASVGTVEWVALGYLLALAALVVPFGRLADLVGRKSLYTAGFVVFILGSALCGLAPSLSWLIAFRVLQAVGAAMLQANSVAIIAAAARPRELGRAIGVQGAAQAIGLALGPSVGGLLIAHLGWQWVFFIAVPFGLLGATLGWLVLPLTADGPAPTAPRERFDWLGAGLFGPAIAAVLVALTYAGVWGWPSPGLVAALALATGLLAAFLLVERRAAFPLIDFTVFHSRVFTAGLGAGLLSYAVLFGSLFLLPFALERLLGYDPGQAGLLLTPVPLALGLVALVGGLAADRFGSRPPTVLGMLLAALALGLLAAAPTVPLPGLLGLLVMIGAGVGLFTPANNSAIVASAPPHRRGLAAGLLNMTRSLGTSFGVAGSGVVLTLSLTTALGEPVTRTLDVPPAALLPAIRLTLFVLAGLAVLTAIISAARGGSVTAAAATRSAARSPERGPAALPAPALTAIDASPKSPHSLVPTPPGTRRGAESQVHPRAALREGPR
jgi:EmrB/QacA subfamily drug resistance transporter